MRMTLIKQAGASAPFLLWGIAMKFLLLLFLCFMTFPTYGLSGEVRNHLPGLSYAEGEMGGYRVVRKFGRVTGASTAVVDVYELGTPAVYSWPTSASTLEVISSSTSDAAAGTGCREVTVEGLNGSFVEITEAIATNGTSASSATTSSFLRVNSAYCSASGAYNDSDTGPNAGNITIRISSGGAIQGYIPVTDVPEGDAAMARYTVPAGYTGYILELTVGLNTTKSGTFWLMTRSAANTVAAPYSSKKVQSIFDGIIDAHREVYSLPIQVPEKTDVWVAVKGGAASTNATASFEIIIVKND